MSAVMSTQRMSKQVEDPFWSQNPNYLNIEKQVPGKFLQEENQTAKETSCFGKPKEIINKQTNKNFRCDQRKMKMRNKILKLEKEIQSYLVFRHTELIQIKRK